MVQISKKALGISIVLLFLFVFTLPISIVPAIILIAYIHWFKSNDFTRVIARLERINGTQLLLASSLTIASIAIYQNANYVTHLGFPSPFIIYHGDPEMVGATVISSPLYSKLAINLFAFVINIVIYYVLLNAIQWLYKKGTLWLGGSVHSPR